MKSLLKIKEDGVQPNAETSILFMPTNYNKTKRVCHVCGSPAKFFYEKWWCTHTRDLKGLCPNQKERKNKTNNNT